MSRRLRGPAATVALVAALIASGAGYATTFAAFNSASANSGDSYSAGTVFIDNDSEGQAYPGISAGEPGDKAVSCFVVTYGGSLPSRVRMWAVHTGTVDNYLNVKLTRGSGGSGYPACTGFTADATDYTGAGPGVVYSGSLASFPSTAITGLYDPTTGSPETWSTGESHDYRIELTIDTDPAGQGATGTVRFVWGAANT